MGAYCGPVPSCGNGVVEADENCDDGNTFPGDGCDAFCRDENTNAGMFALIPVRASGAEGSHWFLGPAANQITLTVPDQTVEFDLMISGYSPALIESYQAGFDCSSFDSGGIGALQPALVECRNVGFDGTPCNGVDLTRPDIITSQAILACNVTNVCEDGVAPGKVSCGTVLWSGSDDPGTPEYAAQFAAHVPAGTGGTFALALDPSPTWTFMIDGSGDPVGRLNLPPALITVRSDCNSNGISDQAEIAAGTVADCNGNGYPDECEKDCNGTSVPDNCDVTDGTSLDCKGNLIPDECEPDCNANLIADSCDIASAVSLDCNANSVPDECDLASGSAADCNANDIPDSCDIITGLSVDCDSGGVPDECEPNEDCNINGVQDICDVALGVSEDCNFDRVPDECQLDEDCNGNGLRDLCDIGEQTSADCNANLVPDSCDLARSTSDDFDGNGIPDECCFASAAPLADSIVPDMGFGTRNRYLSFEAGSTGQLQAIRVLPTLLPPPFDVSDCTTGSCVELWVGQPFAVSEASGSTDPTSEPTFWSASLQCGPLFTDWSQYGTIHAHGIAVVPNGTYDLQVVGELCSVTAEENFSASLQVKTTVWGDMVGSDPRTSPPQGVTDFNDLAAIVDKFMNRPGSVQKSRADVAPELVDHKVDFTDIPAVVDGFRVLPYPYIGPIPCP